MTLEDLRKQDLEDIGALLSKREGARFFSRLLKLCGVYRISYVPGDTHTTAFNEGQRNIGNIVLADLAEFGFYQQLLATGADERKTEEEYDDHAGWN